MMRKVLQIYSRGKLPTEVQVLIALHAVKIELVFSLLYRNTRKLASPSNQMTSNVLPSRVCSFS